MTSLYLLITKLARIVQKMLMYVLRLQDVRDARSQ